MNTNMTMDANELLKKVTVTIHIIGVKRAQFRFKIASKIIALGAWIGGIGFKVEDVNE